jgi:hypothetical protein
MRRVQEFEAVFKYRVGQEVYFVHCNGSPHSKGIIQALVLKYDSDGTTVLPYYQIEEKGSGLFFTLNTVVTVSEEDVSLSDVAFKKAHLENMIADLKSKIAKYEAELNILESRGV